MKIQSLICLLSLTFFEVSSVHAGEVRLAVASNFRPTILTIIEKFEASSEHRVIVSFGSTGKHYAQIVNGAPYDLFFAADAARPKLLEQHGMVVNKSRYTYAVGKLILWRVGDTNYNLSADSLADDKIRHVALANPKLAPYGKAAEQVIEALQLRDYLSRKLVRGENIAQAFAFAKSGNAELGFVAYSQIIDRLTEGSVWMIPQNLYKPIEQQAVLLKQSKASKEFYAFMQSPIARDIISQAGYETL